MQPEEHYIIKTEVFEGPLDLLLSLIEKRKLLINDISLAKITDDYISYIKDNDHKLSIKDRSGFILIASTLLLIKSKSILPSLELSEEEEKSIDDLELRLKIYKKIKEAEPHVLNLFGKSISFYREFSKNTEYRTFVPSPKISAQTIMESIRSVLMSLPKVEARPKAVIQKIISLEEMIVDLTGRIKKSLSMSFKEFSGFGKSERINVIVSFLAMLELVKQGAIDARQRDRFGDIDMQTNNFDMPQYS